MIDLSDADFIKNAIEEVGGYTDEFITIFTVSSSTGTTASLEPRSITWGSSDIKAKIKRVSAREINESGGIYKQDDLAVFTSGSFSDDARIVYRSGTYDVVEKLAPTYIADYDVRFRVVIRRA